MSNEPRCNWVYDSDQFNYDTGCGHIGDDCLAKENNWRFCPFCGRKIEWEAE